MYANDTTLKDVKSTASNLRDEAVDTATGVKNDFRGAANDAGRKVRGFLHSASDEVSHMSDSITKEIRTSPVQSTFIALGVGYILGALFRR